MSRVALGRERSISENGGQDREENNDVPHGVLHYRDFEMAA